MPASENNRPPSLADQLRALGVRSGASSQPPPAPRNPYAVENVLDGSAWQTPQGETYAVEQRYPTGQPHGQAALEISWPLKTLAEWAGAPQLAELPVEAFAFLDTETTGLSGPSGTYAFLIGVGRFESDGSFHLAQFFLRDPSEESAQLAALEAFLAPCQAVVTFNGKAFDVPLLLARYTLQSWPPPLTDLAHVDLLHLARRLWRERLPSRSLANLEAQILGALRSEDDIPGWAIPALYFQYLHDGDARPLKQVFYHNAMDILSLAALMNYLAGLLSDPLALGSRYSLDLFALARLFDDLGDPETAAHLYLSGLEHEDVRSQRIPPAILVQTLQRLALLHKRRQNLDAAIQLWEQAAHHHSLPAHVELAKCYEHQLKNYAQAVSWTRAALAVVQNDGAAGGPPLSPFERRQWQTDLQRRLERLERLERKTTTRHEPQPGSLQEPQA